MVIITNAVLAAMSPQEEATALRLMSETERALALHAMPAEEEASALLGMSSSERTAALSQMARDEEARVLLAMSPEMREQAMATLSDEARQRAMQAMAQAKLGLDQKAGFQMGCRVVRVVLSGIVKGAVAMRFGWWRLNQQEATMGAREHRTVAARRHRERMTKARQQEAATVMMGRFLALF
jgi:Mg/Co/Ni transporter MgtE